MPGAQSIATEAELFEALAGQLTLGRVAQLPGQIAFKEIQFLQRLGAQFGNTPQANAVIVKTYLHFLRQKLARTQGVLDRDAAPENRIVGGLKGPEQVRSLGDQNVIIRGAGPAPDVDENDPALLQILRDSGLLPAEQTPGDQGRTFEPGTKLRLDRSGGLEVIQ